MESQQLTKRDVFGVVPHEFRDLPEGECCVMQVTGMDYDKDVGTFTPIFEKVDLVEQTIKCKSLAGFDLMRTLLAQGKAKPEDFYDDGSHGVNVAAVPANVHDALAAAEQGNQMFVELAKALGLEEGETLNSAQLEKALAAFVAKQYNAAAAAAPAESEVTKDE